MPEVEAPVSPSASAHAGRIALGCATVLFGGLALLVVVGVLSGQIRQRESDLNYAESTWNLFDHSLDRLSDTNRAKLAELKDAREKWEMEQTLAAQRKATEGLTVCNYTSAPLMDVAYVAWDSTKQSWMGHGWFKVNNGGCQKILAELEGPWVYLYGQSGGREWGGDYPFCTVNGAFTLMDPEQSGCVPGGEKDFQRIVLQSHTFTWNLTDG